MALPPHVTMTLTLAKNCERPLGIMVILYRASLRKQNHGGMKCYHAIPFNEWAKQTTRENLVILKKRKNKAGLPRLGCRVLARLLSGVNVALV